MLVRFFIRNVHDLEEVAELVKQVTTCPFPFVEQKPAEPTWPMTENGVS
jgi:hypothetical protein